jgi:hypothetical protein
MARDSPVFADMFPFDGKDGISDGAPLVEFPDDSQDITFLECFYEPLYAKCRSSPRSS